MAHYQTYTIYATMYQGQFKTNEYGYAVTNSQRIHKEWFIDVGIIVYIFE